MLHSDGKLQAVSECTTQVRIVRNTLLRSVAATAYSYASGRRTALDLERRQDGAPLATLRAAQAGGRLPLVQRIKIPPGRAGGGGNFVPERAAAQSSLCRVLLHAL